MVSWMIKTRTWIKKQDTVHVNILILYLIFVHHKQQTRADWQWLQPMSIFSLICNCNLHLYSPVWTIKPMTFTLKSPFKCFKTYKNTLLWIRICVWQKLICSVCDLEVSTSYLKVAYWTTSGLQMSCAVINPAAQRAQRSFTPSADEFLLMSNSAQTSRWSNSQQNTLMSGGGLKIRLY